MLDFQNTAFSSLARWRRRRWTPWLAPRATALHVDGVAVFDLDGSAIGATAGGPMAAFEGDRLVHRASERSKDPSQGQTAVATAMSAWASPWPWSPAGQCLHTGEIAGVVVAHRLIDGTWHDRRRLPPATRSWCCRMTRSWPPSQGTGDAMPVVAQDDGTSLTLLVDGAPTRLQTASMSPAMTVAARPASWW